MNRSVLVRFVLIIFAVILGASFARVAFNGSPLTFSAFLEVISTSNSFVINSALTDFTIYGDWGIFDGFRNFLNLFTGAFSVLVFLISNLINVLVLILNFVKYLFLGY